MKIKCNIEPSEEFVDFFIRFCHRSKPYDFCEVASPHLREQKILEYLEVIRGKTFIEVYDGGRLVGGAIVSIWTEESYLEFVAGDAEAFPMVKIAEGWNMILDFLFNERKIGLLSSTIHRKYRRNAFLRWIKIYDKRCKIEGGKALWTN